MVTISSPLRTIEGLPQVLTSMLVGLVEVCANWHWPGQLRLKKKKQLSF